MNPRDFLTTAAIGLVILVGGLAIADSVRGCNEKDVQATPAQTTAPTTTGGDGPTPQADAPEGWPEGLLDGVLTFVDAETCVVRSIGLSGGRERPLTPKQTDCQGFWAPPISARIAYTIAPATEQRFLIRIADLGQGDREFGDYWAIAPPVWSHDGQRVAWCVTRRTGAEREVLGGGHRLPFCPLAYTPEGNLAHAEGRRLVVGRRTLLTASGPIDFAQFGEDGSIGVLADGNTLVRYQDGEPTEGFQLLSRRAGNPVFSPDTCAAAIPYIDQLIFVVPLCPGREVLDLAGRSPSWSPNGEWLATARSDAIVFHRTDGSGETVSWPAVAAHLAWRSD